MYLEVRKGLSVRTAQAVCMFWLFCADLAFDVGYLALAIASIRHRAWHPQNPELERGPDSGNVREHMARRYGRTIKYGGKGKMISCEISYYVFTKEVVKGSMLHRLFISRVLALTPSCTSKSKIQDFHAIQEGLSFISRLFSRNIGSFGCKARATGAERRLWLMRVVSTRDNLL